ncbi:MAG: hypothetical protein LJF04_13395 [Gemmatimonadetes bacterium]|nr:hypothetical protein [Gemmatimonadota bacterium]
MKSAEGAAGDRPSRASGSHGSLAPLATVIGVIIAAHLSLAPRIAGVDAFYHLGHAAAYVHRGLFDTSFPWATQSVIGDLGADIWWGLHMVLVPFTVLGDVATQIRVAALVFTSALAASVWWMLRRHAVPGAGWWTALFLVAVPNVLFRYLMVRPHVLSLAAALLMLSFLARGRWWQVLLAAAAITWVHLSLFWMAPGIVAAYALACAVARRHPGDTDTGVPLPVAFAAVLAGTLLGWLLRPHPFASAELAYVQIVRLFEEKASTRPLIFATELLPLPFVDVVRSAWAFLLAWIAAHILGAAAHIRGKGRDFPLPERRLLAASLFISGVFLALTVFTARRALVDLTAFGFLALPLVWTWLVPGTARRRVGLTMALLLAVHLPWTAWRHSLNVRFVAVPGDDLAQAATWLAANSSPDDIVFQTHWDDFGPLFARNRVDRYLGGMDPIFQYAHDPGHYWEQFYLSADLIQDYTCDAFPCYEGKATDTWTVIREHFGARWILVEPRRNPKLSLYLSKSPHFELALTTRNEAIFRVLDQPTQTSNPPGS